MDEFESLNSRMPDLQSALAARIAARSQPTEAVPGKIDPYQMMMNRKNGVEPELPPVQNYPEEDIKALQDYCQKIGVVGFGFGKMHPRAALAMLKKQFGEFSNTPLEDRVLPGYEKLGTKTEAVKPTRQVIHG